MIQNTSYSNYRFKRTEERENEQNWEALKYRWHFREQKHKTDTVRWYQELGFLQGSLLSTGVRKRMKICEQITRLPWTGRERERDYMWQLLSPLQMNHLLLSLYFFLFPSYLFISNERMRWKVNSVCPILISRAYNRPPCWMVNAAINTTNIHTSRTNMDLPPGQQSLFSGNVHKQCYLIF